MGFIARNLEICAVRREQSDLGGILTLATGEQIPCAMGVDISGLQRADNSAGFQFNQTRRVVIRSALLADLPRQPQAGDPVTIQGNLEADSTTLTISPSTGIEQMNGILTAINLYNPNA